ncbi:hypothetical protein Baya_6352 [Bagarius yarrelli]|uniref:Uncharacterized protein n=1 Tax=Bagarius yarrelli TaxID=175774 RepID=A0A556TY43_BAGYA|nr:hypothetical protein Baya_6352 [Bagarius yarrelli]
MFDSLEPASRFIRLPKKSRSKRTELFVTRPSPVAVRLGVSHQPKPRLLMEASETCAVITVTLQPRSLVGLFAFRLGRLCAEPERRTTPDTSLIKWFNKCCFTVWPAVASSTGPTDVHAAGLPLPKSALPPLFPHTPVSGAVIELSVHSVLHKPEYILYITTDYKCPLDEFRKCVVVSSSPSSTRK